MTKSGMSDLSFIFNIMLKFNFNFICFFKIANMKIFYFKNYFQNIIYVFFILIFNLLKILVY